MPPGPPEAAAMHKLASVWDGRGVPGWVDYLAVALLAAVTLTWRLGATALEEHECHAVSAGPGRAGCHSPQVEVIAPQAQ